MKGKHTKETKRLLSEQLSGERNGNAKLTDNDVQAIIQLAANGRATQEEIGKSFRITQSHVSRILGGKARRL